MKKILFLLALVIVAGFTACENSNNSKHGKGKTYTITFDDGEGSGGPGTAEVKHGQALPVFTAEKVPTRAEYEFTGYYDDGGKKYYNANFTSAVNTWDKEEDATLYARWTPTPEEPGVGETGLDSSIVALVRAPSNITNASQLTYADIKALIKQAVEIAGGWDGIIEDKNGDGVINVVLKPNLVNTTSNWGSGTVFASPNDTTTAMAPNGVISEWRVVKAVAALIREYTGIEKGQPGAAVIRVMEGSATGSTSTHFNNMKITTTMIPEVDEIIALESEGAWVGNGNATGTNAQYVTQVTLPNFVQTGAPTTGSDASVGYYNNDGKYWVNNKIYNADAFISIPMLKNHSNACVTGGVKNISIGATPPRIYGISNTNIGRNNMVPHFNGGAAGRFHQWIADYFACIPADFTIMDGLQGTDNGPLATSSNSVLSQSQKNLRVILASRDALALDTVEANIMNWDYSTVPYLVLLTERGQVGINPAKYSTPLKVNGNPRNITVLGNVKVDDIRTFFNVNNNAGNVPTEGGTRIPGTSMNNHLPEQPTVDITSAAFTGKNLNLKLTLSANVVKVDVYIDGTYVRSFNGNMADITLDTTGIADGSKSITVHAFSRYMRQNTASVTVSK